MRRWFAGLVAPMLIAMILVAAPSPMAAAEGFTFYGSGYGHGIGMSQWGAYGLAQMGWQHGKILRHFYRHTEVGTSTPLPRRIRVGLTWGRTEVRLRAEAGPVSLWLGSAGGTRIGSIPAGKTWRVIAGKDAWAIRRPDGRLVGGRRWGDPRTDLVVTYADAGARVFIPEADAIWGDGFAYARGTIEMNLTSCGDGNGCVERLIARLPFEEYLFGLGEVPASWPMEAMRAQAVAARTYAAYVLRRYGLRAECNCDISDGASDQTYIGFDREGGASGDRWVEAVRSTRAEVVTYRDALIQAFYAASDGGHSDSVQDVWHGGNDAYAIPWLTGVCDPGESTAANPWTSWSKTYTAGEVTARLAASTGPIGTIRRFTKVDRGVGGRIVAATAVGTSGARRLTGAQLKSALGWYDLRVWINADRTIRGEIRETYDRLGCRPGLPVSPHRAVEGGAQQLFANGGIYTNRAAGLTVWLRGAIDAEFRAVGAAAGVLGVPNGEPSALRGAQDCAGCTRTAFVGGRIYASRATGAHALWGNVLETYLDRGGAGGALGMPTSRVRSRAGGGVGATFEHGSIACVAGSCDVTIV